MAELPAHDAPDELDEVEAYRHRLGIEALEADLDAVKDAPGASVTDRQRAIDALTNAANLEVMRRRKRKHPGFL